MTFALSSSGLSRGQHLFRAVLLVAVGAEPGVGCRQHVLQLQAVAHQQARPAEAPLRRVAAAALRLPCNELGLLRPLSRLGGSMITRQCNSPARSATPDYSTDAWHHSILFYRAMILQFADVEFMVCKARSINTPRGISHHARSENLSGCTRASCRGDVRAHQCREARGRAGCSAGSLLLRTASSGDRSGSRCLRGSIVLTSRTHFPGANCMSHAPLCQRLYLTVRVGCANMAHPVGLQLPRNSRTKEDLGWGRPALLS